MAIFRTNPSRDVLTPQMREAMYAQLENRMSEQMGLIDRQGWNLAGLTL